MLSLHLRAVVGMDEARGIPRPCRGSARAECRRFRTAGRTRRRGSARCPTTSCRDWRDAGLPADGYWRRRARRCAPCTRLSSSAWVRRRFSSLRRRIATSALSARLGTDRLIMKVSSSRKDSLRPKCAERPGMLDRRPDGKAGQDHADGGGVARAAPQRRPHQRQDRQEAERAGIFRARQQRAEGDAGRRRRPTASTATTAAGFAARRSRASRCCAHSTITGVTTSAPAASPSHQVTQIGAKFAQSRKARHAQRHHADGGADHGRRPDADQREFRHPRRAGEGLGAARPALDQKAADHALPAYCRAR